MKRDDLIKLFLTEGQTEPTAEQKTVIDQIMDLHGKGVEKAKADLTAVQAERDGLKTQLAEANTTIEGFKKLDVDGVQKAAEEWKSKAEQAQKEAETKIKQIQFDHALEGALTSAKAKNATAVRALLKVEDLKLKDDGSILGLDDQLKAIKETNDFLFEGDKPTPRFTAGGEGAPPDMTALEAAVRKGAGLLKTP